MNMLCGLDRHRWQRLNGAERRCADCPAIERLNAQGHWERTR
jgi:hypothetical protein